MKKILLISLLTAAVSNAAVERDICIALDGSGSMGSDNFDIQKNATAQQVEDGTIVPVDGTVAISVVRFASSATVEVSRTVIDSAATASAVADQIRNIAYTGGTTNMTAAISTCANELNLSNTAGKQIIDLSTDGEPDSLTNTIAAADGAIADGVDAINALGTGSGVDKSKLDQIVRPQPSSTIPDDGFVVIAPDFNSYTAAIKEKMTFEATGKAAASSVAVPFSTGTKTAMAFLMAALSLLFIRKRVEA